MRARPPAWASAWASARLSAQPSSRPLNLATLVNTVTASIWLQGQIPVGIGPSPYCGEILWGGPGHHICAGFLAVGPQ